MTTTTDEDTMLHTIYQGYGPCGFRQKVFLSFHVENLFLACVTEICNGPTPFEQLLKRAI